MSANKELDNKLQLLASGFNKGINELMRILKLKAKTDKELSVFDCLSRRLNIVRLSGTGRELIESSAPVFIEFLPKIIARDEDFLNKFDIREHYRVKGIAIGDEQETNIQLMESIRNIYANGKPAEKNTAYANMKFLAESAVDYYCLTHPDA